MTPVTPSWILVDVTRTRLGTVETYRDPALRARKEVLARPRLSLRRGPRCYYTLDGRRRVYRTEDDLINAIMRGRNV